MESIIGEKNLHVRSVDSVCFSATAWELYQKKDNTQLGSVRFWTLWPGGSFSELLQAEPASVYALATEVYLHASCSLLFVVSQAALSHICRISLTVLNTAPLLC